MRKPYVFKAYNHKRRCDSWFVGMFTKRREPFNHWRDAVAFAIYVYRNPHVMHDLGS